MLYNLIRIHSKQFFFRCLNLSNLFVKHVFFLNFIFQNCTPIYKSATVDKNAQVLILMWLRFKYAHQIDDFKIGYFTVGTSQGS